MSNIFAMNGQPRQLIVSLGLGKRFKVEDLDQFYAGLNKACAKWNVDIVGGDTTSSYTGLAINLTCIGEAAKDDIVYRSGAMRPILSALPVILVQPTWACKFSNVKRLFITNKCKSIIIR